MKKVFGIVCAGCIFLFLAGCATTSQYGLGRAHLEKKQYDQAIQAFVAAIREEPNNALIWRDLGVALYEKGIVKRAGQSLLKAFLKDSTDGRTLLYLGMTFEDQKDYRFAIDVYRRYVDLESNTGLKDQIEARLNTLIREQMKREAQAALKDENSLDTASLPENTVAVLYFKNMGAKEALDPLQKGIADMMITDLSRVRKLKVVERLRLQKLLEEMGLGMTGLVDEASAPRVGKLLGAGQFVSGSFLDLSDYRFRIDAGLVQTKDQFFDSKTVEGKLLDLFKMEKDLVFEVIDGLGIPLSQQEREEIRIIPTDNILAFMAYCRGLDFEDKGMFGQAAGEYQKSLQLDPQFSKAKDNLKRTQIQSAGEMKMADLVRAETGNRGETETRDEAGTRGETGTGSENQSQEPAGSRTTDSAVETRPADAAIPLVQQVLRSGEILNQSFLPGIDARKPNQEQSTSSFGSAANFLVRVYIPQSTPTTP